MITDKICPALCYQLIITLTKDHPTFFAKMYGIKQTQRVKLPYYQCDICALLELSSGLLIANQFRRYEQLLKKRSRKLTFYFTAPLQSLPIKQYFISPVEHFLFNFLSFQRNCTDQKKLMRFSGQFTLSVDCARQGTSYKYVVVKKGNVHWEGLLEFPSRFPGGIVNRFLSIPKKYLKPGGKLQTTEIFQQP